MTSNVRKITLSAKITLAGLVLWAVLAGLVMVATITSQKTQPDSSLTLENVHYTDVTIYVGNNGDMTSFCAVENK